MLKLKLSSVLIAGGLALATISSANATTVTYDLTFADSGGATGVLTLDIPGTGSLPLVADGLDLTNTTDFVSLIVSDITNNGTNYGSFDITPSDVSTFTFKTNTSTSANPGRINALKVLTTDNDGNTGTTPFLEIETDSSWQINEKNNSRLFSEALTESGPFAVTATPLPATWPLLISGLGLIGLLSRRRTRKSLAGMATA
jgi:hypothetical protein